jgi:hypothetical protein
VRSDRGTPISPLLKLKGPPSRSYAVGGLLTERVRWSREPFEETFRGPRGLRKGVVHDLERLYRLRRTLLLDLYSQDLYIAIPT